MKWRKNTSRIRFIEYNCNTSSCGHDMWPNTVFITGKFTKSQLKPSQCHCPCLDSVTPWPPANLCVFLPCVFSLFWFSMCSEPAHVCSHTSHYLAGPVNNFPTLLSLYLNQSAHLHPVVSAPDYQIVPVSNLSTSAYFLLPAGLPCLF